MAPRSLSGQAPRPHRCRRRRCLLKGCGQWFEPTHPQCRYCSASCREAARRWRRWHAQHKYRGSQNGREHRRQQSRRYRERCRNCPSSAGCAAATADGNKTLREGKRAAAKTEKVPLCPCDRPGCYELFPAGAAQLRRRFCCVLCRKALHCVLQREARWRQRCRRGLKHAGRRRRARPCGP
jgi:hypothetical protein